VAFACALRFIREAHPGLFDPAGHPALEAHARGCEARPEFAAVYQPITNVV
jgi:glutathione S-transferase